MTPNPSRRNLVAAVCGALLMAGIAAGCSGADAQTGRVPELIDELPPATWCDSAEPIDVTPKGGAEQGWTALIVDTTRSSSSQPLRQEGLTASVHAIVQAAARGDYLLLLQATGDSVRTGRTLFAGSLAGEGPNDLFQGRDRDQRTLAAACTLHDAFETDQTPTASDLVGAIWSATRNEHRSTGPNAECTIVLASDGLNNASGIDLTASDALDRVRGAGLLPEPDLTGCTLAFTHLGRGATEGSPAQGPALQAGWEAYAAATGAELVPDPAL